MKHYVYRITNTKLNKHYYGTRTSKNTTPQKDIGYIYFSSSSDKDFIKDQKNNPSDYKYKVISTFSTRKKAIELEIKLHNKFNVGINESFYNLVKQSSKNFDTTGNILLGQKHSKLLKKEIILENGVKTSIAKITADKSAITRRKNSKKYNIILSDGCIYKNSLVIVDVIKIYPPLRYTSKEKRLGYKGLKCHQTVSQKKLISENKNHLLGAYIEKV